MKISFHSLFLAKPWQHLANQQSESKIQPGNWRKLPGWILTDYYFFFFFFLSAFFLQTDFEQHFFFESFFFLSFFFAILLLLFYKVRKRLSTTGENNVFSQIAISCFYHPQNRGIVKDHMSLPSEFCFSFSTNLTKSVVVVG